MRARVKKCLLVIFALVLLCSLLCITASAEEAAADEGVDDLLSDFSDILPPGFENYFDPLESSRSLGFDSIISAVFDSLSGRGGEIATFFLLLLGCGILMAVSTVASGDYAQLCRSAVATVCSVAVFSKLLPLVTDVGDTLSDVSSFFSLLVPLMSCATALGGGSAMASAQSMGMTITLQVYGALSSSLSLLVGAAFAFGMIGCISDDGTSVVARGVRTLFTKGIGILTACFGATLALQTVVAGAADSASMRAAKYAASGMIPVVGNTVSGALSLLAGGLSYAKGVVGGGAIAVILGLTLSPLVVLLLYKLCFFLVTLFLEYIGAAEGVRCLGSLSGALDALISVYSMSVVIYILETVLFVVGGVAVS